MEALGPPELDDLVSEQLSANNVRFNLFDVQLKNMMLSMTENDKSKYPLIEKSGKVCKSSSFYYFS